MPEIAVLGNFVVDIIGKPIDRLPERGRLLMIDTLETHPGGNGPNTAGALGRLGAAVRVLGRVGEDLYGRFLLEKLEEWGVDTRAVARDPGAVTGLTLVPVDRTGERSFIHHFGANADFTPGDIPWSDLAGVKHLHLASFFVLPGFEGPAAAAVLTEARRRRMTTSIDVCWDRTGRWLETLRPCLPHVDYLMPSEEEARELTGKTEPVEIVTALRNEGAGAVVLKLGERGCLYAGEEGVFRVPAYRVEVRETTGAGDCFIAGFLLARVRGWDLERALRFANACGARSVTAVGGVTGMAPAEEIEDWARGLAIREEL
jgi:sugar/nucleoside kinase (ribokinase family)